MKDKNLVFAIILAIVLAVFWVISSVLSTSQQAEVGPNVDAYLNMLSPKFNTEVLRQVSDRTQTGVVVLPDDFRSYETLQQ